jgi:hypothetical protein
MRLLKDVSIPEDDSVLAFIAEKTESTAMIAETDAIIIDISSYEVILNLPSS